MYFNGFQRLSQIFGRLIHVLLQLALCALQCLGHGIDPAGEIVQFAAALFVQPDVELPPADTCDCLVDMCDRTYDSPAHSANQRPGYK